MAWRRPEMDEYGSFPPPPPLSARGSASATAGGLGPAQRRPGQRRCVSARAHQHPKRAPVEDYQEHARLRVGSHKSALEARFLQQVGEDDGSAWGGIRPQSLRGSSDSVVDTCLGHAEGDPSTHSLPPCSPAVGSTAPPRERSPVGCPPRRPQAVGRKRPGTVPAPMLPLATEAGAQVFLQSLQQHTDDLAQGAPTPALLRSLGVPGAGGRLAQEVSDLQAKMGLLSRDKAQLQERLQEREDRVKRLEEDVTRLRKDPSSSHPAVTRLRKMGLNTPALANLDDRWAGYVFGRCSTAMEVGNYSYRAVFASHARGGVLTEESFKRVIMQFEPSIKSDQLTRLWFFADSDGSGHLDLFEYMRLFGVSANGDMTDEFYDTVVMHMYNRLHTKGGVRRVCSLHMMLSPKDWLVFLQSHSFLEWDLTKQEKMHVFDRINVASNGHLTLEELDSALESAGAKCFVSEKWVRETFSSVAGQIQVAGLDLRTLVPSPVVSHREFAEFMRSFMPLLKTSELDRLWKFVWLSAPPEHVHKSSNPVVSGTAGSAGHAQPSVDAGAVLSVAFGPSLTAAALQLPGLPGSAHGVKGQSSTGFELLEQVAGLLLARIGRGSAAQCFEALDPYLSSEHFHEVLTGRLGLQLDALKTKQIFSLCDCDRDGKITLYEFESTFRILFANILGPEAAAGGDGNGAGGGHLGEPACIASPTEKGHSARFSSLPGSPSFRSASFQSVPSLTQGASAATAAAAHFETPEAETHRLQSRRLMNRIHVMERELQQQGSGQGRIFHQGELVPVVPEKQYRQLSVAHAKAMASLHATRTPERRERCASSGVSIEELHPAGRDAQEDISLGTSKKIGSVSDVQEPRTSSSSLAQVVRRLRSSRQPSGSPSHALLRIFDVPEDSCGRLSSACGQGDGTEAEKPAATLAARCAELEGRLSEAEAVRAQELRDFQARMQAMREDMFELQAKLLDARTEEVRPVQLAQAQPKRFARRHSSDAVNRQVVSKADPKDEEKGALHVCGIVRSARRPQPGSHGNVQVSKALRKFAVEGGSEKHLAEALEGLFLDDRFRIGALLSVSERSIKVQCHDLFLDRPVVAKMARESKHGPPLAKEACVMSTLAPVPHVPTIFHFSGAFSTLPYIVTELLQGETLALRFKAVQEGFAEPISFGEAAEMSCGLLQGVDQCHQHGSLNLGLSPDTVWLAPPLSGSRVRLLDWELSKGCANRMLPCQNLEMVRRTVGCSQPLPRFFKGRHEEEISPSTLLRMGAGVQEGAFPSTMIQGHGALYYMALEQMFQIFADYERGEAVPPPIGWCQSSMGSSVRITEMSVYWFQKGDGLVITQHALNGTSPLGRVFEVEASKVLSTAKRSSNDLGVRIGLSAVSPARLEEMILQHERQTRLMGRIGDKLIHSGSGPLTSPRGGGASIDADEDPVLRVRLREEVLNNAWIIGGDCAFYCKGKRIKARNAPDAAAAEEGPPSASSSSSSIPADRYITLGGLKPGDRLALLAEWNGNISLFVNGLQIGNWPKAMSPWEVVQPLYGVVDLHQAKGSEDFVVRSVALRNANDGRGTPKQAEVEKVTGELMSIHRLISMPVAASLGPSCDVYACGRLIAQCFRGGLRVTLSPTLVQVWSAFAQWVCDGCPCTENKFYLLAAIRELQSEKQGDLQDIEHKAVRSVLARALKHTRYARLTCCMDFLKLLNEATCWLEMTPEFLRSHADAAERTLWLNEVRTWYSRGQMPQAQAAQALSGRKAGLRRFGSSALQESLGLDEGAGKLVPAIWDLRPFSLGQSHVKRVVQVLTTWRKPSPIRRLVLARFAIQIPQDLQPSFSQCFNLSPMTAEEEGNFDGDTLSRSQALSLPRLFLEDTPLPAERLPPGRFGVAELLERRALWVAVHFVRDLNLEPDMSALHGTPITVGSRPAAVSELAAAIATSRVLVRLGLRSSGLDDSSGRELAAAVRHCKTLQHLDLSDNNMGSVAVGKVVDAVMQGNSIISLDLSRNALGPAGAQSVACALSDASGTTLAELNLARNGLRAAGAEALCECLLRNTSLTHLDLTRNEIPFSAAGDLMLTTVSSPTLKRLVLDENCPWPSYEGSETLVRSFVDTLGSAPGSGRSGPSTHSTLESLSLRRSGIRSTAATELFSVLQHSTRLKRLNLAWNGIRHTGMEELAAVLMKPNHPLEELDLRDNLLGKQEAFPRALAEADMAAQAILNNHRLRLLHLGNNGLTATGVSMLAAVLSRFEALQELFLYHNADIGDDGMEGLARLLNGRTAGVCRLKTLGIAACGVGDRGGRAIAAALAKNEWLETLDMSCNALTRKATPSLAEVLSMNKSLQHLNLSMNFLCSSGLRDLARGLAEAQDPFARTRSNTSSSSSAGAGGGPRSSCSGAEVDVSAQLPPPASLAKASRSASKDQGLDAEEAEPTNPTNGEPSDQQPSAAARLNRYLRAGSTEPCDPTELVAMLRSEFGEGPVARFIGLPSC